MVKVRQSALQRCSVTSDFSRAALCHLYFSRVEFWLEKLRNTELRERAGEEQGRNYVTHEHDEHKKEYVEDDDD